MKISPNFLFRLNIFLLSSFLVINPLNIGGFPGAKVKAQAPNRPYVVFVNGYQDCCTWRRYTDGSPDPSMDIVVNSLPFNSEIQYVPWDRFESGANQRSSTSNDAEFLRQAADFINKLDRNRPLILIGHSFGGDSLLSLAPRINRSIEFLGVIDPTAAGGLREPVTHRGVPSNVNYFFNRWEQNAVALANLVPIDSRLISGSISGCRAKNCDQQEQSLARTEDGSEIRISCESWEVSCPGYQPWPGGSNGTKAKRLAHNEMPYDGYLQRQMANAINSALSSSSASSTQLSSADLCWYQHSGWQNGSVSWASGNCTKVGSGWSFKTVFASSDGVVYGINANNELFWYKHNGWQNGSSSWVSGTGTKVGSGWSFKTVFASSNGVIYGINTNNELCWYKHNGWQNGSSSWASNNCTKVGTGWNFTTVFASSNGVIYGVKPNGDLYWYRHDGWQDGSNRWANGGTGIKVGNGWNFRSTFATSNGTIYGILR